ncbi:dolichol-phosphate mannosyltransferase [Ruminiclostridium sufflavum DSM 19573]|uniref:Dolichol-phosphate mannosyltransferase n=1 Tax=Ruminiclostridium sufflavum DSM 19573 TaxID=1121337 RepID=A0A318XI50_9FIRM|nr:glycosyltransferase family 2 protein [Ruminiclostridium sufflavum]PYG85023.1 dolichol-phosphate mannosyltransferase [Ruminiclostridium sufflavum DSM 19573]
MSELTVLLPAYNEEGNLEALVERWQEFVLPLREKYSLSLHIASINDGSIDNTRSIGEMLERKYNNFTLVNHNKNFGLGEAVKTAVTYALKSRPHSKYVCLMDCDNTHDPKYIIDMLDEICIESETGHADVIIASRYQKGACVQGLSKYRLFMSKCAKLVYRFLFNINGVTDYTCGYRLYSREVLTRAYKHFGEKMVEEQGFSCMAELLYKLNIINASFKEIPFELRYDYKQGKSKMNVVKTAVSSIKLAFRLCKLKNNI